MEEPTPSNFKTGFVAVMGRPNVGKSTLVNALMGQKIAAVSPRPQTTRKRQMGILTRSDAQVIFIDTPGVHQPRHKLGESMNLEASETLQECDVILFMVEANQLPGAEDHLLMDLLNRLKRLPPVILALNKADLVDQVTLEKNSAAYLEGILKADVQPISALHGDHLDELLAKILALLPQGTPFFPEDQITDLYERDLAADLIREAALNILRDEVPHGIAVRIDQFAERENGIIYIEATLFVERESHKPIVIGQNGTMLKKIGMMARQEIEAMIGDKVFLDLHVKVRKNWRDDDQVLRAFGYSSKKK